MIPPGLRRFDFPEKPHCLIGFHDCSAISPTGEMILLGVDTMDRPPVAGEKAQIGITSWPTGRTRVVAETDAWNFPQGGRQHFIRQGAALTFNVSCGGEWIGVVLDLANGTKTTLAKALYAVSPDGRTGYGLNFARLHRLGGYGYVGLPDPSASEHVPNEEGLWQVDLESGQARLLISIAAVVDTGQGLPGDCPHYLTHVVPSPSGRSLCFLHRYWLPDGGIRTRLMVCGSDGGNLRCWGEGYLSHFDWWDEDTVLIWGRPPSALQQGRNHPLFRVPLVRDLVRTGKPLIKKLLGRGAGGGGSYMLLTEKGFGGRSFASDLLREDGHPSLRPGARDWLLTDTYPDKDGVRPLLLCPVAEPRLIEIARLRETRHRAKEDRLAEAMEGMDERVRRSLTPRLFAHTRSGIHCDFHPRWLLAGDAVCFDSNHEGTRSVYGLEVGGVLGIH